MLRRGLIGSERNLRTMIAARLLGIREFSLAGAAETLFRSHAPEGFAKANWAQRPLPVRMAEYAINDVIIYWPAENWKRVGSQRARDWLRQSCQRAIEQARSRARDHDELGVSAALAYSVDGPLRYFRALWHGAKRAERQIASVSRLADEELLKPRRNLLRKRS